MYAKQTDYRFHLLRFSNNLHCCYTVYIFDTEVNLVMKHPNHSEQLASIRRIEGQIKGIGKMIEDERYCIDILNQIKAVRNSIARVEGKILKTHLRGCVKESLDAGNDFEKKVEELLEVLKR